MPALASSVARSARAPTELVAVVPPDVIDLAESFATAVRAGEAVVFFIPIAVVIRAHGWRHVGCHGIPGLVAAQQLQVEERAAFVVERVQVSHCTTSITSPASILLMHSCMASFNCPPVSRLVSCWYTSAASLIAV